MAHGATIQFYRGPLAGLPTLAAGEPAFTTDTYQFYIGDGAANHEIGAGSSYTDEEAQDAVGTILTDTDTVAWTYADGTPAISAAVRTQLSITSDASGIKLSGDSGSPGNNKLYGTDGSGTKGWYDQPSGGSGTVTSVALTMPTGFSVSGSPVTTSGTLAVTTALSGILKGAAGAITTASAGTDYEVPLTFSTGLTRSTNTVTVNTTQNIAKLSNLTSNGFLKTGGGDGTLSVDTSTYLTGNQSITLSGDVSGSGTTAITTTLATVTVAKGGTGQTSLTAYAVLCGGTTSTGAVQPVASVGTSGQVLTSNGAGALPTFQTLANTLDIAGLTAADPAFADAVPEYNAAASANRKATLTRVGGLLLGPCSGGRLTLTTAVPETTSDVTAATTVYYTPYLHDRVTIYDGTRWNEYTFSELSIKLTDSQTCTSTSGSANLTVADSSQLVRGMKVSGTGIAGGTTISSITSSTVVVLSANASGSGTNTITFKIPADKNVDVFLTDVSGSPALRFSNLWTNGTTRADALANQSGYATVNNAAINSADSNTVAAKCGLLLGTVRTTGTDGQTEDSYGGGDSAGGHRYVSNRWNPVVRAMGVIESANSWFYTTDSYQAANADSNNSVYCVQTVSRPMWGRVAGLAANNTPCYVSLGIGLDLVTSTSICQRTQGLVVAGNPAGVPSAEYEGYPGLGHRTFTWLERSQATGTTAFYGDNGNTVNIQSGLVMWGWF